MKKIPYDLYIYLDDLRSFFKGNLKKTENFLSCGMASLEISTYLMGSLLRVQEDKNIEKIEHILKGIETQFNLLNAYNFNSESIGFNEGYSKNIENLKLLDLKYARRIDRITELYFEVSKKVQLGLDDQINQIRDYFFLVKLPAKKHNSEKIIEYPDIVEVLKLNELEYFNSEDETFMMVHQISECWFNIGINELKTIERSLDNAELDSAEIEEKFKLTFKVLNYLSDNILLLDLMVLADYHPLRVALRGASGGQSMQAYELFKISKKLFEKFLILIEKENKNLVHIIENPKTEGDLLSIINNFTLLERGLKNFFFQHYVLTSNIIGSESFGSIGHDLVSLVGKFIQPIFKEIDQAKYDLTLKTNYQYGKIAGKLILEKEDTIPAPTEKHTSDIDTIIRVTDAYFAAISSFNQENWINLFAKDGFIEDPIGSRPYHGHQQLAIFFKGVIRFFSEFSMTIENMNIEEDCVKVFWNAKAKSYNNKEINYSGLEIFRINDSGKIMSAQVEWEPAIIADQL
ncbi:nuclear transport factor 2 family protein [Brumimicrobium oceani]|uniref:SnoaL-like domain-containing protein n=1 Tax=Brumimicrobium oceani TaxID=2100725 RepID=A0A2U2XAT9_9FLAO|nr:nuclear transport factor 2 family protein [Brumimicrobium oceani]PWH84908.1 hypothetical protein DIT68_12250 [Brumimicrobium oceani]